MNDEPTLYLDKKGYVCYVGNPPPVIASDISKEVLVGLPTISTKGLFHLSSLQSIEITPHNIILNIKGFVYTVPHTAKTYKELQGILHSHGK